MSRRAAYTYLPMILAALASWTGGCGGDSIPTRETGPAPAGTVRILAAPADPAMGWTLTGPDDYMETGSGAAVIDDLDVGTYTLAWSGRAGWIRPDPAVIGMTLAEGDTLVFDGTFSERSFTPSVVLVSAGSARIGSPVTEAGREEDEPRHRVTLTRDFLIRDTEVTQAEYLALIDTNPSHFGDCPDCPVERLSWLDAIDFCNALSGADGLEPVYAWNDSAGDWAWDTSADGWRLPTEAEWEYACRAGVLDPFTYGACLDSGTQANFDGENPQPECAQGIGRGHTLEVARLEPNAWGLYDMHGNVWEWCWDIYAPDSYVDFDVDPSGASQGFARVARGGSWLNHARHCRSAYRGYFYPYSPDGGFGLRPVRWAD